MLTLTTKFLNCLKDQNILVQTFFGKHCVKMLFRNACETFPFPPFKSYPHKFIIIKPYIRISRVGLKCSSFSTSEPIQDCHLRWICAGININFPTLMHPLGGWFFVPDVTGSVGKFIRSGTYLIFALSQEPGKWEIKNTNSVIPLPLVAMWHP